MYYSKELKESTLRRLLPPNSESVSKVLKEEGIPQQTLRTWLNKARKEGHPAPGKDSTTDEWSTQDKFLTVVETASLSEAELGEYARKKGLYVEQIKEWRDACMNASGGVAKEAAQLNRKLKDSEKERKNLEREIQRKVKALEEAAALLVLSKKANAIWADCPKTQLFNFTATTYCGVPTHGLLYPAFNLKQGLVFGQPEEGDNNIKRRHNW